MYHKFKKIKYGYFLEFPSILCFLVYLSHQVEVLRSPCFLLNIRLSKCENRMRLQQDSLMYTEEEKGYYFLRHQYFPR